MTETHVEVYVPITAELDGAGASRDQERALQYIQIAASFNRLRVKDLRPTFASHLLTAGVGPE